MKKQTLFMKFASALMAVSMVSSLNVVSFANTTGVADTITIELENYTKTGDNAQHPFNVVDGMAQINYVTSDTDEYAFYSVDFDAAESGYYALDISAACYGPVPWLSKLSYVLNDDADVELYTNKNYRLLYNSGSGTFTVGNFSMTDPVYLNKGTNTILFYMGVRTQGNDRIVGGLDKVVFTPLNTIPSNGKVELENYAKLNDNATTVNQNTASNKQIVKVGNGSITEPTYYEVKLNMSETAQYSFGVAAGCDAYLVWLSPLYVSINGGEYEPLIDYAKTDYSGDTTTFGTALFTRPNAITLNAGENSIIIKSEQRAAGGTYFSLDYLFFDKLGVVKNLPASGRIEGETYATEWGLTSTSTDKASEGASAVRKNADKKSDSVSLNVNVAQEGDYLIALGAGCGAWAAWLSPLSLSINGAQSEDLSTYGISSVIPGDVSGDAFRPARMTRQNTVHLNAGVNTFTINASEREAGGIYYSIDYIDIIKVQNSNNIGTIPEGGRFEVEDFASELGLTNTPLDVASNGASAIIKDKDSTYKVASIAFTAEEAESALLQIGVASKAWAPWLSPVYVSLNGGVKEDLLSFSRLSTQGGDNGFRNADMLRENAVGILEGLNVITFYAESRDASYGGGIYFGLDYIEFTSTNPELQNAEMYLLDTFDVLDVAYITVMDGSSIITPEDVYQMTYASTNEEVAVVDGNGMVTAVGPGKATIKVGIKANKNSTEVLLTQDITVLGKDDPIDEEMFSISDVNNANGVISFNFNSQVEIDSLKVIVANYDNSGRMLSAYVSTLQDVLEKSSTPINVTISDYISTQIVKVFAWYGDENLPLIESEIIK